MPRPNWFCLPCRWTSKKATTCPHCHGPMECAGHNWRLPRKTDLKGWRKLLGLIEWKRARRLGPGDWPTYHSGDCTSLQYTPTRKEGAAKAYRESGYARASEARRKTLDKARKARS